MELFGDEVESIRTFDPESQVSIKQLKAINIIPNVQESLLEESRQSIFEYIPEDTLVWFKDFRETTDLIEKGYQKAKESFDEIMKMSGSTQVVFEPDDLFDSEKSFTSLIQSFKKIEFGKRFYLKTEKTFEFRIKPQPTFHKKFEILCQDLREYQDKLYEKFIASAHN